MQQGLALDPSCRMINNLTILSLALQAGAGAEREALIRRAADAEKATCALLDQHSREAAAIGVQTSVTTRLHRHIAYSACLITLRSEVSLQQHLNISLCIRVWILLLLLLQQQIESTCNASRYSLRA